MAEPRLLKLQSPAYGEAIFYKWPLANTKKQDEATEIADTIKLVCEDFPELKYAVENFILKDYDPTDYDSMNQLCQRYNKAIKNILQLWKGRAPPPHMFKPAKKELLRHVINLCYSHAIKEPEKLNLYEPFSPEVYGETSFDMVAQILEECQSSSEETFIDLGSGVGQVVLQAAATNKYKECIGIEKAETPAMYAQGMDKEFRKWMDWFGKIYTDFTLEKGDFLEEKWMDTVNNAGFVFVNNFAFGPVVNHHLKQRFQQMKEGVKIISSREFCPLNFKFNKRNLSELGAMMRVTELKPKSEEQTVSWTGNIVSYYLHVVDRTRLEKYFSILKKRKEGRELDEDELSLYSESNLSMETTGTSKHEESLEDNLDGLYLGTTTRHQWQVLNKTIEQSRQDAKPLKNNKPKEKKKKKKKIMLHDTEEEDEDEDYIDEDDVPYDEKPPRKTTHVAKSSNIKLKDKILQKYSYQKMKKNLLHPSTATLATTNNNKRISAFSSRTKSKPLSISTSPSASDSEATDSAFEIDVEEEEDNNNNRIKPQVKKKKKEVNRKKKINEKFDQRKKCQVHNSASVRNPVQKPKEKKQIKQKLQKVTAKKPLLNESLSKEFLDNLDKDIDEFYDSMKKKAKDFICRMNTKEYAARLKVMIECEQTKKKLLQREVAETAESVQQLIASGLNNFTNRLEELDLAVKTPFELLSTSKNLEEKRQQLEEKVVNMEVEVLNLEEKYKNNCTAREQFGGIGGGNGVDLIADAVSTEVLDNRRSELTSKLCGSILSALNHRRSLLDKQSSLNDQISILEKIASPLGSVQQEEHEPMEEDTKSKERQKQRPVAFVPPRMLSDDKQSTVSPETPSQEVVRRPRGRPKKNTPKPSETIKANQQVQPKSEENNNVFGSLQNQTSTSSNSPVSNQYNVFRATEERAPIVFPRSLAAGNDTMSAEFLKASIDLLNSKGKWRPLNEVSEIRSTFPLVNNEERDVKSIEKEQHLIPLDEKVSRDTNYKNTIMDETKSSEKPCQVDPVNKNLKLLNEPQSSIYDNLKLAYSHQYHLMSHSLPKVEVTTNECIPSTFSSMPSSFVNNSSQGSNLVNNHVTRNPVTRNPASITKSYTSTAAATTPPFISSLPTPSTTNEEIKKKNTQPTKGKRGRKRKSETVSGNVVIPGLHKHPDKDELPGMGNTRHDLITVDQHFKTSLEKFYQPFVEKNLAYIQQSSTKQKQIQSVITLNPVPHSQPATVPPNSIVIPPSIPSHIQTISHRQTNIEILKQAAIAALPEKSKSLMEPFRTLSTPVKQQVFAPSSIQVSRLGESGKSDLKDILPHTSPLKTNDSLYALHNRIIENNSPGISTTGAHSYIPLIPSSAANSRKPTGLQFDFERPKLTPALNNVMFRNQYRADTQPKSKRQKKDCSTNPSLPVIIPSAMLSGSRPTHNDLLRSMLLSSSPVISPQTLLVVNSNGQHPTASTKTKEGHPRLVPNLAHSTFPVVQTFAAPGPLVIVPVPGTTGGKNSQSTNASPTFPPPPFPVPVTSNTK